MCHSMMKWLFSAKNMENERETKKQNDHFSHGSTWRKGIYEGTKGMDERLTLRIDNYFEGIRFV